MSTKCKLKDKSGPRIREVLVVHTSHTDIGYTHLQPAVWELHARYIDRAIALCEASADRPEGQRFCWTCHRTPGIRAASAKSDSANHTLEKKVR
jgi:hypothetical protein